MTGSWSAEAIAEQKAILFRRLQSEADWRRSMAEGCPGDKRILQALELFEKLAATAKDIPNDVFGTWLDFCRNIYGLGVTGAIAQAMGRVGFHTMYNSATELMRELIAQETERITPKLRTTR
jgi:hypothetical protein